MEEDSIALYCTACSLRSFVSSLRGLDPSDHRTKITKLTKLFTTGSSDTEYVALLPYLLT